MMIHTACQGAKIKGVSGPFKGLRNNVKVGRKKLRIMAKENEMLSFEHSRAIALINSGNCQLPLQVQHKASQP